MVDEGQVQAWGNPLGVVSEGGNLIMGGPSDPKKQSVQHSSKYFYI